MTDVKLIEQNDRYAVFEASYLDFKQVFRSWHRDGTIEMKFTNEFAKANGFKDIPDMLEKNEGMKEILIRSCVKIPEWIIIDEELGYIVRNMSEFSKLN